MNIFALSALSPQGANYFHYEENPEVSKTLLSEHFVSKFLNIFVSKQ